jgi:mono/diheme cytochrome c family protein
VWFTTGSELGLIDGNSISVTTGQHVAATVRLSGSPSGDVWVFDGPALHRYACDSCRAGADATWRATIQPIFTNYCAQCHRPGGVASIDLSTYESWVARRAAIRMRVTVTRDMPPPGNPLPAADRMAIADWVASGM